MFGRGLEDEIQKALRCVDGLMVSSFFVYADLLPEIRQVVLLKTIDTLEI